LFGGKARWKVGIITKTRLMIRDQSELLNQIAGTYKDFFRAALEYVDNAIDAATILRQHGESIDPILRIEIDTPAKKIAFIDNCGGMSTQELMHSAHLPVRPLLLVEKKATQKLKLKLTEHLMRLQMYHVKPQMENT
jgi:2-methylcitrate dehydratase PrpD